MKRLFLAAEAKHPTSYKKLEDYIGGFDGKRIAYIPTAANGEETYGTWKNGATWNLINTTKAEITPVPLEDFKGKEVLPLLKNKDIIWFAGGMCGYLMYWVRRFEIDKHIQEILELGTLYVGSSAGSIVCAKTLDIAEAFVPEVEIGASVIPGFGLIDFNFFPHYEDSLLPEIKKVWKGNDLYLVKNGEALIVEDGKVEVFGERRILRDGDIINS